MSNSQIWKDKLAQSRADLLTLLSSLTPEQWGTVVFSEGDRWTIHTVVSHLVDSERGMSIQVHKIRKGEETVPEGFDLQRWNAGVKKRIGDASATDLLAALSNTRAKTLEVMDSLQEHEWSLQGRHPSRGMITVEQYYETIHGHEIIHARDIRAALHG